MTDRSVEKVITSLREPLTGVSEDQNADILPVRLVKGIKDPPTYIVMLALGLANFRSYRLEDKSAWEYRVHFEGLRFALVDWKRSSWELQCEEGSPKAVVSGIRLRKKITAACKKLNSFLITAFSQDIKNRQFYLNNNFLTVSRTYEFYVKRLKATKTKLKKRLKPISRLGKQRKSKGSPSFAFQRDLGLEAFFRKRIRLNAELSHYAAATAVFFFSLTELYFNIAFALSGNRMTFAEFLQMTWAERCKQVLPVSKSSELADIYFKMLKIKKSIRDQFAHGFTDEEVLLVSLPKIGLIPLSYEKAAASISFNWIPLGEKEIAEMLKTFDEFTRWIENNAPFKYYLMFARSGQEIPFAPDQVANIVAHMRSKKHLEEYLENRARLMDAASETY